MKIIHGVRILAASAVNINILLKCSSSSKNEKTGFVRDTNNCSATNMSLFRNKAELYNEKRKAKNDYKISTT